jgi:DNA-binding helix-hairpin-helix protein with protein kinase domain
MVTIEAQFACGWTPNNMSQPDVTLSSLQPGQRLGSGGQGEVHRVKNHQGTAFKRYFDPAAVNAESLRALVEFPDSLDPSARAALLAQTAWPQGRVTDSGRVVGFLMQEVPAQFFGRTTAGPKLRELQYLLYPPKPMWGDIKPLDSVGRVHLAHAFVKLMRTLHDHSMVLGDISMRNLLWSPGNPPDLFVLDCDGAHLVGYPTVLPQPETPGWEDPYMPATGLDLDTDCYKVACAVGRILAAMAEVRPGEPLKPLSDIPQNVAKLAQACFKGAAGVHGTRPTLSQWAQALTGREMITLPTLPSPPQPPPKLPMADLDQRGPRETMPLPPFGSNP